MDILDIRILEGKDINTIMQFTENLKSQNLEGIINAHNIYDVILDKIESEVSNKNSYLRGIIKQKIWNLEKQIGWNSNFYSQAGQDRIIYDVFFKSKKQNGYFVDIGAYDGITGSNSYFFEKNLGWEGILIEPSRNQFSKLEKNRKNICFNNAISNKIQSIEFIDVIKGLTQMSGLKQESYTDTYNMLDSDLNTLTECYVIDTSTFSNLVKRKNIDYLSIDIEGGELDLIHSIDFSSYQIKVLSIENNKPNEIIYHEHLSKNGFVFFDFCGQDEIYYNPNLLTY